VESGWRGIRTSRYKYATFESKPWILYDLEADPFEMNNLIGNPTYKDLQQKMHSRLVLWMKKTGDTWGNNWTYPFADNFELMKAPFYSVEEFFRWKEKQPN
jgi:arylsulfatase A-like enzyme